MGGCLVIENMNVVALYDYGGGRTFGLKAFVLGGGKPSSSFNYAMEFTLQLRKIT